MTKPPIYTPIYSPQAFQFPHILANTCYFLSLRFLSESLGYLFSVYLSSYKEFYVFAFPYEHQFGLLCFIMKVSLFVHFWIICTFPYDYIFKIALYQELF